MSNSTIDALRTRVEGEVVAPGDGEYEEARKVYNGMIDKHPAAVVRCIGPHDVAAVIDIANTEGLDLRFVAAHTARLGSGRTTGVWSSI